MAKKDYKNIAIVVAGGSGTRFGGDVPKQFLPLKDDLILLRAIRPFEAASNIDAYCVVVPAEFTKTVSEWGKSAALKKMEWVVSGGSHRQDSMIKGFQAIPPCEIVLIHDGARPLLSGELVDRVIAGASEKGACIPGMRIQETLKKIAKKGHVITTVDRNNYVTIQTPQAFRHTILAEAIHEAVTDGFYGTDEAMLVERMGFPVCVVEGMRENIKVTTPEDLKIAEVLLNAHRTRI